MKYRLVERPGFGDGKTRFHLVPIDGSLPHGIPTNGWTSENMARKFAQKNGDMIVEVKRLKKTKDSADSSMITLDELKAKYCMDGIYDVENRNVGGKWVKGLIEGYDYEVLVFPKGSQYGINKGRISKLNIRNKDKKTVAEYERGWTVKPKDAEGQRILKKVIALYPGK